MRKINIKFLFFDDKRCNRCKTIEDSLDRAIKEFKQKHQNTEITIERRKLTKKEIGKSPTIFLDNRDIEFYLSQNFIYQQSHCVDCSCLIGKSVSCRTYGDNENLSKEQIFEALDKHVKSKI